MFWHLPFAILNTDSFRYFCERLATVSISYADEQAVRFFRSHDDDTPSDNLAPVVKADDDTFKSGPVGMMGITNGVSYFDNMVLVESIQDLERLGAVDYRGKLASMWGKIKSD